MTDKNWTNRLEYVGVALEEPGYHIWGASPVLGPNGKIHLFVARWPVSAQFNPGWYTHCEIARYVSDKPEGPFIFEDIVLTGTGSTTWDSVAPHNPTVHKVGNRYALLYIANTGRDFPASQKIGMATSLSLDGPWEKVAIDGLILAPPDDRTIWSHGSVVGVNNPALLLHPDGRYYLYYKAMAEGDVRRMGVAISENLEGPYVFHKTPLTSNKGTIEDGYAFVEGDAVYLLTTDYDEGNGLLWKSHDGLSFGEPTAGFGRMEDYIPKDVVKEATNYRSKNFERPQLLFENGRPTHMYLAAGANINKGDGSCSYVFRIKDK